MDFLLTDKIMFLYNFIFKPKSFYLAFQRFKFV